MNFLFFANQIYQTKPNSKKNASKKTEFDCTTKYSNSVKWTMTLWRIDSKSIKPIRREKYPRLRKVRKELQPGKVIGTPTPKTKGEKCGIRRLPRTGKANRKGLRVIGRNHLLSGRTSQNRKVIGRNHQMNYQRQSPMPSFSW